MPKMRRPPDSKNTSTPKEGKPAKPMSFERRSPRRRRDGVISGIENATYSILRKHDKNTDDPHSDGKS
jgi:hypothetical protein